MIGKRTAALEALVLTGLLVAAYTPTIVWMVDRWLAPGSYWAHGPFLPPVAALWAWARLRRSNLEGDTPSSAGFPLLVGGLAIQAASVVASVHFTSAFSALLVAAGLVLWLRGPRTFRVVAPPLAFLAFMIPIPLVAVAHLTLGMKLFSAEAGVRVLRGLGFEAGCEGSFLFVDTERLLLGDACSGLRSLVALLAVGFLLVHLLPLRGGGRAVAFLLVVPLALAGNVIRVVLLGVVAARFGSESLRGPIHTLAGLAVYLVAIGGLVGAGALLGRIPALREGGR